MAPRFPASRRVPHGITLIGLLFWAVLICSVALVVIKVIPALTEYRTVVTMVNRVAKEGGTTVPEIRAAFERARQIEYGVTSITGRDLEITKEGEQVVIRFAYDRQVELVSPVYLLIKFEGRSK